jgi:Zn-dependent M28 family amino/carboxypeptidase
MLRSIALLLLAACAFPAAAQDAAAPAPAPTPTAAEKNAAVNAMLPPDQAAMKAHVMFLAADALKGRDAGSAEYAIAAQYVAAQFYAQGLRPAGDDGSYLQTVPLLSYKPLEQGAVRFARAGGEPVNLVFGEDYIPGADPTRAETRLDAEVVFVGYGIDAPQFGLNAYKGVDVKGKVVAFLQGAPRSLPGEERAHFNNPATKAETAAAHGAIGSIALESPLSAKVRPFAVVAAMWNRERMTWVEKDGKGHIAAPGTPNLATLSLAGAAKLFEGAKTPWAKVMAAAEKGEIKFKAETLKGRLAVALKTETRPVTSYNVAGLLPGSDPAAGKEVVVLSAHLDHIGVATRPNAKGDTINNGAMDNAVGIASLIEEARRFKESGKAPRRSILFLAVTAEEKGLVGADYFAHNPTLPKANLVANVNLDMPIITYKFSDIIVFGAPRSTLGPIVERAATAIGVTISPDPLPDEGLFTRSDHYRFVQQGIPSVFLWPGEGGPGKAAVERFLAENYHKPSDEIVQDPAIDWESGVRFIEANYRIAREIADADQRPLWNKGDFFGTLYGGPGAK